MKLLIVTQKVDRTDPILGFFHEWIVEFAKRVEHVTVIGQQVGSHAFPRNVTVRSLQKEQGAPRKKQISLFKQYCLRERANYDCVFVHMTPIWILIGAPIWLFFRKPMYLWYEIKRGSLKLSLALLFVRKVFAASEHGLPAVSKKQVIVGHGIDLDQFVPDAKKRKRGHVVSVGRITAIKHYEVILRAFAELPHSCRLTIAGGTVTDADKQTKKELQELMHTLSIADRVTIGWVAPDQMVDLLQRADLFLHASQGGLDKAVLQAMACGCPSVSVSEAAQAELPLCCRATTDTMAEKANALLTFSSDERTQLAADLRRIVEKKHSLEQCIARMVSALS